MLHVWKIVLKMFKLAMWHRGDVRENDGTLASLLEAQKISYKGSKVHNIPYQ